MDRPDHDTRVGAYAVLVDDRERILLALWNEGPTPAWTVPGGGIEEGETPEQAAVREVREETGYEIELIRPLGEDVFTVPAGMRLDGGRRPLRCSRLVFEARIVGGRLTAEVGGTTDEAAWIPIADVAGLERVDLVDTVLRLAQR
jgi:8-oxo-dGTP diphosphatase